MMFKEATDYRVQGRSASSNEFFFATALEKLDIPFMFQFELFGMGGAAGAIYVDFLVWTPLAIPCEIVGEYWHANQDERFRHSMVEQHFNREIVFFSEEETATVAAAQQSIRAKIA